MSYPYGLFATPVNCRFTVMCTQFMYTTSAGAVFEITAMGPKVQTGANQNALVEYVKVRQAVEACVQIHIVVL